MARSVDVCGFAIFTAERMARDRRLLIILLVAGHTALLACYTFPRAIVPEHLRVLGQLYARPLFHQQWLLFAPDPPACSCRLEARVGTRGWADIDHGPDTYLQRRSVQALARHVQAQVHAGDTRPARELLMAMRALALHGDFEPGEGRIPPDVAFRLVERCVVDPTRPLDREERVTALYAP